MRRRSHAAGRDGQCRGVDCRCASAQTSGRKNRGRLDFTVPPINVELVNVIQPGRSAAVQRTQGRKVTNDKTTTQLKLWSKTTRPKTTQNLQVSKTRAGVAAVPATNSTGQTQQPQWITKPRGAYPSNVARMTSHLIPVHML